MNQMLSACTVAMFVGLVGPAVPAERVLAQQSAAFPIHIAIPEKFGAPIRERLDELEDLQRPEVPMPIPAPRRAMERDPAAAQE